MDLQGIEELSQKELEQFKKVCNYLLNRTFVFRTSYQMGKGRINNPDYTFLSIHFELVRDYLSLLDWDLYRDDYNGYFYVFSKDEVNRLTLTKTPTAILLALRMIYDENQDMLGLERDAVCTTQELLEKIVTDYAILSTRPNMEEVKRALTMLENYSILQRIEGKFSQMSCRFAILPTILTAVSGEKLKAVIDALRKEEEDDEEAEASAAD